MSHSIRTGKFVNSVKCLILMAVVGCYLNLSQTAGAVPVAPGAPDYSWLFDGNDNAYTGGVNGTRSGTGGPNPAGPVFSNDVPLVYTGNQSLAYDGVNDAFSIPDTAGLRPNNGAWTSAFWFKTANTNAFAPIVQKRQAVSPFNQYSIIQGNIEASGAATASKKLSIVLLNSAGQRWWFRTVNDIVDGNWHQVVFTRDLAGTGTLYVDGILQSLTQVSLTGTQPLNIDNTVPWTLGWNNGTNYLAGRIDEVAFWNEALTAGNAEFLAFNSVLPPPAPEPSSLVLLGLGSLVLAQRKRRARGRHQSQATN